MKNTNLMPAIRFLLDEAAARSQTRASGLVVQPFARTTSRFPTLNFEPETLNFFKPVKPRHIR
jgi:hypothetical protein